MIYVWDHGRALACPEIIDQIGLHISMIKCSTLHLIGWEPILYKGVNETILVSLFFLATTIHLRAANEF